MEKAWMLVAVVALVCVIDSCRGGMVIGGHGKIMTWNNGDFPGYGWRRTHSAGGREWRRGRFPLRKETHEHRHPSGRGPDYFRKHGRGGRIENMQNSNRNIVGRRGGIQNGGRRRHGLPMHGRRGHVGRVAHEGRGHVFRSKGIRGHGKRVHQAGQRHGVHGRTGSHEAQVGRAGKAQGHLRTGKGGHGGVGGNGGRRRGSGLRRGGPNHAGTPSGAGSAVEVNALHTLKYPSGQLEIRGEFNRDMFDGTCPAGTKTAGNKCEVTDTKAFLSWLKPNAKKYGIKYSFVPIDKAG